MSVPDTALANLASRIQLKKATILLVDANPQGMEVLGQILMGFGATGFLKAAGFEAAQKVLEETPVDLVICEAALQPGEPDGYDLVDWLRRSDLQPNAFAPAIVTTAHTSRRNVARARDCGAHFVVMKPLAPAVLLDRIVWIAQTNRPFVACGVYVGPDRRFQNLGPPDGAGRRSGDLPATVGEATAPNMSQDEIDSLMNPRKAAS